jgi:hypothetical protein
VRTSKDIFTEVSTEEVKGPHERDLGWTGDNMWKVRLENGTDRLARNVGKEPPFYAA